MKETKLKPFDLAQALAGKPVITRDGREVLELHLFKCGYQSHPLVGVIQGLPMFNNWRIDGTCHRKEDKLDLFMAPIKTKYYVYVYKEVSNNFISSCVTTCSKFDPNRESDLLHTSSFEIEE